MKSKANEITLYSLEYFMQTGHIKKTTHKGRF